MTFRLTHLTGIAVLAAVVATAGTAKADPVVIGLQSFVDFGVPTADTGNINTATMFTLGNLISTANNSGIFAGMPSQFLGPVSFNISSPTSLTFGNSVFGTFTSTSIQVALNNAGFLNLDVTGTWTPGTFGGVSGGPFQALLGLTFTQDTPGGIISDSASFAVFAQATEVPEPSTLALGVTGLIAGLLMYRLRRRPRHPTMANFA